MKFRIRANTLSTFGQIMGWLSENGTEDQYDTEASQGYMVVIFKDEQFAVQCKIVWSEFMVLV